MNISLSLLWLISKLFDNSALYTSYHIPSVSMMPTLHAGDVIITRDYNVGSLRDWKKIQLDNSIQYGDVIVYQYPNNPKHLYVSRIVGLPRDHITFADGVLTINDQVQQLKKETKHDDFDYYREYLQGYSHQVQFFHDPNKRLTGQGSFIVPEQHYFVMSDNRDNAIDGRLWNSNNPSTDKTWGFLPKENIIGKALFISMNSNCLMHQTNCDRFGKRIE